MTASRPPSRPLSVVARAKSTALRAATSQVGQVATRAVHSTAGAEDPASAVTKAAGSVARDVGTGMQDKAARLAYKERQASARARGKVDIAHPKRDQKKIIAGASFRRKAQHRAGGVLRTAGHLTQSTVRERMIAILEGIAGSTIGQGGYSRPQNIISKLNDGPPSAHREREWWSQHQKGAGSRSKAILKRAKNLPSLGQGGPGMTTG